MSAADVALYTSDALEEAFYALISDHARSIEDRYETFFFEDQDHPDREQIHDDIMDITTTMIIHAGSVQEWIDTGKEPIDPTALRFLREAKRLGKKCHREQLQVHQEQHQDTQQRKRTRTRQRRTPLLMPMDASSASDKKRKVIEGESSPRGLKRMRFG